MKKILLSIFVLTLSLVSCNGTKSNEYKLEVNASGVTDDTKVYIKQQDSLGKAFDIDSATVKNGKIELSGIVKDPAISYFVVDGIRGGLPFILEEGNIAIDFNKDTLLNSSFGGTKSNEDFYKIFTHMQTVNDSVTKIRTLMRTYQKGRKIDEIKKLNEKRIALQEGADAYELTFAQENPNSFVSLLILEKQLQKDPSAVETIDSAYQNLKSDLKTLKPAKNIEKIIERIAKVRVGAKAQDITGKTLEGDMLSLSNAQGKVTLLDFWASWCKPCRKENPNVKKIYEAYHQDGLNIVGVSTDRNEEAWKKAVEEDGITWTQMISTEAAKTYNIRYIPATFLLNAEGVIMKKDLRGEELEAEIAKLLGVENKKVVEPEAPMIPTLPTPKTK